MMINGFLRQKNKIAVWYDSINNSPGAIFKMRKILLTIMSASIILIGASIIILYASKPDTSVDSLIDLIHSVVALITSMTAFLRTIEAIKRRDGYP